MRIAVVSHFYPPEPCAAATRVSSLVAALAGAGHEVTVVTNFPSFPSGRFARGDRFVAKKTEASERVNVVRLFSLIARGIPGARLIHWGSAAVASTVFLLVSRKRYDGIVVSMPPITLALPALVGAWRHRARLVVDVRDVFPDIAIAMGEWKRDGLLARASEWLVRKLYKRADLIVAVTPTALGQIAERGIDPSRLMLARNAAEIVSQPSDAPARRNGFTAIYAGNLGLATDVDVLVDAAALLKHDDVTIEIVGDGAQRVRLDERLRGEGIENVVVKGSIPRDDAMGLIAQADVSIVPLRKGIRESVPTKLYDAFSVGCPVVIAAEGEASSEGAELGAVCVEPGDAPALADALRRLAHLDPGALRELGAAGKARVQKRADRAGIMEALAGRISRLA